MRPTLRQTLFSARAARGALMAFNVQNAVQLDGLIAASSKHALPVIAQFSAKYASREAFAGTLPLYLRLVRNTRVYLHLDHCDDPLLIMHCIRAGFDSVMFDGSALELAENIDRTNAVVAGAAPYGCLVEAELGRIGGVEDDHGGEAADTFSAGEFRQFCASVDASLLAPAIGNLHGFYASPEKVRLDLLPVAQECLRPGQFLVLHGGTGLSLSSLRGAANAGAVKVNISTALKSQTREILFAQLSASPLFDQSAVSKALCQGLVPFYANLMQQLTGPCSS